MKRPIKAFLLSGLMLLMVLNEIHAQRAIDFLQIQGNSEELFLRIISESDAVSAGNGVVKIQLPDGSTGAADLVATSDPDASELRIETPYGTHAWREETFYAKAYGDSDLDIFHGITASPGGGFALAGHTVNYGAGSTDFLLIQTDEDGSFNWGYAMGFDYSDWCFSILTTNTGGYFLSGISITPTYDEDAYIYHVNGSGSVLNSAGYGNSTYDQRFYDAVQTSDNNFVAFGYTQTASNENDMFINKINQSTGSTIWAYEIGSSVYELGKGITKRADGGFVGTGLGVYGDLNLFLCFISPTGIEESTHTYGGSGNEDGNDIITSSDGNYVACGRTSSIGAGAYDFYILKADQIGNSVWSVAIGGTSNEEAEAIVETKDKGFLVVGQTTSYGAGSDDIWLVKTDSLGNPEWSWVFGGSLPDYGNDIYLDDNGCIYVVGNTWSYGAGNRDALLVKFSPDGKTCLGSPISPGSDYIVPEGFTATRMNHFNVDRTPLPMRKIDAHCFPMKQDLQQKNNNGKAVISITPTVTTICN